MRAWHAKSIAGFALVLFFLAAGTARADDCDCERYRPLVGMSSLGRSVFEISREAYDNVGREFAGGPERRAIERLGADSYAAIPERCRQELMHTGRVQVYARGALDQNDTHYEADTTFSKSLVSNYNALMKTFVKPSSCGRRPSADCLKAADVAGYATMQTAVASRGAADLLASYGGAGAPLAGLTASQVQVLQAFNGIMASKSAAAALDYVGSLKDKLTTDQKLQLVQTVGARFNADYDYSRNAAQASAEGAVSLRTMLTVAQTNVSQELPWSTHEEAGVCRDIASAQGQLLERLGFHNSYVVSEALRSGSYHVTVITQDPEYDTLYRIDYGARRNMAMGDARALYEGSHDVSLNYRVAKPGGAIVADVQSEFGKFMTEAAGFSLFDVDPFASAHGTMLAANVDLARGGWAQARLGTGSDGLGNTYLFAGGNVRWNEKGLFPGAVGLVIAEQMLDGSQVGSGYGGAPTGGLINLDVLYVQLEQRFRSPGLSIGKNTQARIEAMATAIFAVGRAHGGTDENKLSVQGDIRLNTDVRVDQKAWNDRIRATYMVGASVGPGLSDIRDVYMPQVPNVVLNNLFFSAEGRLRLSQSPEGRAYLIAATTVLVDGLGVRGRAEAGVFGDKAGASIRIEGRVTNDTALFEDGSARAITGSVYWNPSRVLKLSVSGSVPLEKGTAQGYAVMGNVSVQH